jgi:diphthine-ammonia ligase
MYQTVGNSGINYIAKAIGLPLFEYTIQGSAINITSEYGSREGKGKGKSTEAEEDETEDLYQLLLKVKVSWHY